MLMSGAGLPCFADADLIHWLGCDSFFKSNAPLLAKCEISHVGGNGGVVSNLDRSIRLLAPRPDAIHPIPHMIHALRFTFDGGALGTIQALRIVLDAGGVLARHHIRCAADMFDSAVAAS